MSLNGHLQQLKKKHETLSKRVEEAQRSPSMDGSEIRELKKQKLKIKEEIARLDGGTKSKPPPTTVRGGFFISLVITRRTAPRWRRWSIR